MFSVRDISILEEYLIFRRKLEIKNKPYINPVNSAMCDIYPAIIIIIIIIIIIMIIIIPANRFNIAYMDIT